MSRKRGEREERREFVGCAVGLLRSRENSAFAYRFVDSPLRSFFAFLLDLVVLPLSSHHRISRCTICVKERRRTFTSLLKDLILSIRQSL